MKWGSRMAASLLLFVVLAESLFDEGLDAFEAPVDEDDDGDGDAGFAPEAVAADAAYGGGAPDGGGRREAVDGEAVLHDDTCSEEANAGDDLREDTQVVVVHRSASGDGVHDDALAEEYEEAGAHGDQGVGGQACLALLQFALRADDDACQQGADQSEDEDCNGHFRFTVYSLRFTVVLFRKG